MKNYSVAIVGATGAVGRMMLKVLEEQNFPISELYLLASKRSKNKTIQYNDHDLVVQDINDFDFSNADISLFSAGSEVSKKFAPTAAEKGSIVIDNTSYFRYEDEIPLIVPEVNPEEIENFKNKNIIANPNCSTIQMVVALKPIHDLYSIQKINVSTYQAVSGTGVNAINELISQIKEFSENKKLTAEVYPKRILFNALPHIDSFMENRYTKEEMKMVWETQKILDKNILVNATAVRIPVITGHSESIHVECEKEIVLKKVFDELYKYKDIIKVIDDIEDPSYPTTVESEDSNHVFVGRLRNDINLKNSLNLWVVSNNLRKGAAYNSVQIAELLVKKKLI